ncbi:MAG: serine/threonine protein kinase [Planctomycetes bacterium]|nr:serine/threonine protein kinase [Planctomycetota bacterium]
MLNTTHLFENATITPGGREVHHENELAAHYERIVVKDMRLSWTTHHRLIRKLGEGGQGVVYLTDRRGSDGFTLPVALKVFSPARFSDVASYEAAMTRIATIASRVAMIQHDNLLDIHNFVVRDRIRMMVMEWIDGYDLKRLLEPSMLSRIQQRVSARRWEYINRVVVTAGPSQSRLKAGVAMAIVRECLGAIGALHREGIVHGDIKPANVMLKCTGNAKLIDTGSAFPVDAPPLPRTCTPAYAAPEVLEGTDCSARGDLASLGYVLIEMLAGRSPFAGLALYRELLESKRSLPHRLHELLPSEVTVNTLLMKFIRGLIAPDPIRRFPSAEAADLLDEGAAAFQRQLVKGDLSSEYDNEIRLWLHELRGLENSDQDGV